ncbi:hypothetical protein B0A49_01374 [Cryomyces minteri]|uniref:Uncharacterized protein n=1 Tax=Cryomyces minteri TaxID=331657 RepID=A0A4U0XM97_9PEZI|nr:hypothetical protein B0A49_01374 [Cryomyces minteri]
MNVKSLSKDSKRASKHDVSASSEEEERQVKQRLEEELLSDKAVEDGGYDADAHSLAVTEAIKLDSLKPWGAPRNSALRVENDSRQSLKNSYDWLGPMLDGQRRGSSADRNPSSNLSINAEADTTGLLSLMSKLPDATRDYSPLSSGHPRYPNNVQNAVEAPRPAQNALLDGLDYTPAVQIECLRKSLKLKDATDLEREVMMQAHQYGKEVDTAPDESARPGTAQSYVKASTASVHLYNMRISQHLRSMSQLSVNSSSRTPTKSRNFEHQRGPSTSSVMSRPFQRFRHHRQASSCGFASATVPTSWGNVVRSDQASSVYSTYPNSTASTPSVSLPHLPLNENNVYRVPDTYDIEPSTVPEIQLGGSVPASSGKEVVDLATHPNAAALQSSATVLPRSELDSRFETKISMKTAFVPSNASSVSLGKTSRFKEELTPSPPKKHTRKRKSTFKFLRPSKSKGKFVIASAPQTPERNHLSNQMDGPADDRGSGLLAVSDGHRRPSLVEYERRLSNSRDDRRRLSTVDSQALLPTLNNTRTPSLSQQAGARPSLEQYRRHSSVSARRHPGDASAVWEKALRAHQNEKASMFLSPEKRSTSNVSSAPQFSLSFGESSGGGPSLQSRRNVDHDHLGPLDPIGPLENSARSRSHSMHQPDDPLLSPYDDGNGMCSQRPTSMSAGTVLVKERQSSISSLQAWSRYPSHTREQRTGSAGAGDDVTTRDFALLFPDDLQGGSSSDSTPVNTQKRKSKSGLKLPRSTTFGRNIFKYYAGLFKSQSQDFRRHGMGHRSSIATGGVLEYPELELLPPVLPSTILTSKLNSSSEPDLGKLSDGMVAVPSLFRRGISSTDGSSDATAINATTERTKTADVAVPTEQHRDTESEADKLRAADHIIQLGGLDKRVSTAADQTQNARIWSQLYQSCVQLPQGTEDLASEEVLTPDTLLLPPRLPVLEASQSLPSTLHKRSGPQKTSNDIRLRSASVLSVQSVAGSLRASTLDLYNLLKEAETKEREKLISGTGQIPDVGLSVQERSR